MAHALRARGVGPEAIVALGVQRSSLLVVGMLRQHYCFNSYLRLTIKRKRLECHVARLPCRVIGTVNSVQAYWTAELPRYGKQWQPTKTVLYSGATQSQCGTASNQVGPFYCPLDQRVYFVSEEQAVTAAFRSATNP